MGVVASLPGASSRAPTCAGAAMSEQPPAPPFPLSAAAAFELALWYTRFGLDQLPDDPRCQHPAVRAHATAALTQHVAVQRMIGAQ